MSSPVGSISDTYTGGFPTLHQDLGPCILFGILYLITTGVTGWRISQYRRCKRVFWSFIRMTIFQLLRITTMILRAVDGKNIQDIIEGKGNFNEGLFIGEQVSLPCRISYTLRRPGFSVIRVLTFGAVLTGVDQYRIPIPSIDFDKIYDIARSPRRSVGDSKKAETFHELY